MNEAAWLTSKNPKMMLEHLKSINVNDRKVRLFICACWRTRLKHVGSGMLKEIKAVEANRYRHLNQNFFPTYRDYWYAATASSDVHISFTRPPKSGPGLNVEQQVAAIRDIFGNPFQPVEFSPEWRTDTAVTLAKQMHKAREYSAMPILADALQDAGCDNEDVLTHCRDANMSHICGCWVVDLVLGKE
jgi:hypothetical protein